MIDSKVLLERMLTHFGKWNIIRRNPEQSIGGKLLSAVAEETVTLNQAIEEYVQGFFLPTYLERCQQVLDRASSIYIGQCDLVYLKLVSPALSITQDLKLFENNPICAYYEEGYLFFRIENVAVGEEIQFEYKSTLLKEKASFFSIWNIYDEFALFKGLERFDQETNAELLKRILYVANVSLNSTESGLKCAILGAMQNYMPELMAKDIRITMPSSEAIYDLDYEGKQIFEILAELNKDIYRFKKWDRDYWAHDISSISYLPHKYDSAPQRYQEGIGDNEDLKISLTGKEETLHLDLKMYKQSEKELITYLKNYPINEQVPLELYKPQDLINPIEARIKIQAGTLAPIKKDSFSLEYHELEYTNYNVPVGPILSTTEGLSTEYPPTLEVGATYRIKVDSLQPYGDFKANAFLNSNNTPLFTTKDDFFVDKKGHLSYRYCNIFANQIYHFKATNAMTSTLGGFKIKPEYRKGYLKLVLNNLENHQIQWNISSPEKSLISSEAVSARGFEYQNGCYESKLYDNSQLTIRIKCNQLSFKVEGPVYLKVYYGSYFIERFIDQPEVFESPSNLHEPVDFFVILTPTNHQESCKVSDLLYASYSLKVNLLKDDIIFVDNFKKLPDHTFNEITFEIETYHGQSPVLSPIYIGNALSGITYTSDPFIITEASDYLVFNSKTCKCLLEKLDENEEVVETIEEYESLYAYRATETVNIPLNLSEYETVDYISTGMGRLTYDNETYTLRLEKNETIYTFYLAGFKKTQKEVYTFEQLLGKAENYYISPIFNGFVLQNGDTFELKKITLSNRYGYHQFKNHTEYDCSFVLEDDSEILTDTTALPVTGVFLKNKKGKLYTAYNSRLLTQSELTDIPIEKTFTPFLPDETLFYKLENLDPYAQVCFYKSNQVFDENRTYSIGYNTLHYRIEFDLIDALAKEYRKEMLMLTLDGRIPISDTLTTSDNKIIDLAEYVLRLPEGYEVVYGRISLNEMLEQPQFVEGEMFFIQTDGFKHLKYCMIEDVFYIGTVPYHEGAASNISAYHIEKEYGLIIFDKDYILEHLGSKVYIIYTYRRPRAIEIALNKLYSHTSITEKAYHLLREENVTFSNTSSYVSLMDNTFFLQADLVKAQVQEAGYTTSVGREGIFIYTLSPKNCVAARRGYYYIEDQEYYWFSKLGVQSHFYNDYILADAVDIVNNTVQFYPKSTNYLLNSQMYCSDESLVYHNELKDKQEHLHLNLLERLNACEQLNFWQNYGASIYLAPGLYNQGVGFKATHSKGKVALELPIIPVGESYTLSFYLVGKAQAYLVESNKWHEECSKNAAPFSTIIESIKEHEKLCCIEFTSKDAYYTLVLTGDGTVDDMLLCPTIQYMPSLHQKNINQIFWPLKASKETGERIRYVFDKQKRYTGTARLDTLGNIVSTASMGWHLTEIFNLKSYSHGMAPEFLFENNIYYPLESISSLKTPTLFLKDVQLIDKVYIHLNGLDEEKPVCNVFTGISEQTLSSLFVDPSRLITIDGKNLKDYLQVELFITSEMPLYDMSVHVAYKQKEDATPKVNYPDKILLRSEWFDLGTLQDYQLCHLLFETYEQSKVFIRYGKIPEVPTDFTLLQLDKKGNLAEPFLLRYTRYIQFEIKLAHIEENCHLSYFDVEVL